MRMCLAPSAHVGRALSLETGGRDHLGSPIPFAILPFVRGGLETPCDSHPLPLLIHLLN